MVPGRILPTTNLLVVVVTINPLGISSTTGEGVGGIDSDSVGDIGDWIGCWLTVLRRNPGTREKGKLLCSFTATANIRVLLL